MSERPVTSGRDLLARAVAGENWQGSLDDKDEWWATPNDLADAILMAAPPDLVIASVEELAAALADVSAKLWGTPERAGQDAERVAARLAAVRREPTEGTSNG